MQCEEIILSITFKIWIHHNGQNGQVCYRTIQFEDVLATLVSIFLLLRDERKGREKKGREAFDPNGIGKMSFINPQFTLVAA